MSKRDERLVALKEAVKSAESKLKNAELSVSEISSKLETSEAAFERKFEEKAAGYKAQTGADFTRTVDERGRVTYGFSRETTLKEQKRRRQLVLRRRFDTESGTSGIEVKVKDGEKQTFTVKSVSQLSKPEDRKRFISYSLFGYRRLDISAEASPFFKTVGAPIVVPVHTARKLYAKLYDNLKDKKAVKIASKGAEIAALPVILPARFVKDIYDKGGIIHAVTDMGNKIQIDVINTPKPIRIATKPVKAVGNAIKSAALGTESAAVNAVKETEKYTVEIAKEAIYEEIHKTTSENEAAQAAFVIGMKTAEIYKILNEHTKFRRAVRRDKVGDDITDVNISLYLADKEEKKYSKLHSDLSIKAERAKTAANEARWEYEAAKYRLEEYIANKGDMADTEPTLESESTKPQQTDERPSAVDDSDTSDTEATIESESTEPQQTDERPSAVDDSDTSDTEPTLESENAELLQTDNGKAPINDKVDVTKFDKKIERAHDKLHDLNEKSKKPVANMETTVKRLDGLAVGTALKSMRRKAMRDGNDNTAVEAANAAIIAAQQANAMNKAHEQKRIDKKISKYEKKLGELENEKKIEITTKLYERENKSEVRSWLYSDESKRNEEIKAFNKKCRSDNSNSSKLYAHDDTSTKASNGSNSKKPRKKSSTSNHDKQKAEIKRRQHKKAQKAYANQKKAKEAEKVVAEGIKAVAGSSIVALAPFIVVIIIILAIIGLLSVGGGGAASIVYSTVQSQCSTSDLGKCDQYYTELATKLIKQHQNIKEDCIGYSKYVCKTTIDNISHSPNKLLAYLDARLLDETAKEKWKYDDAVPYIEELFNSQYEFFTEDVHEVRTAIRDEEYVNEDDCYYWLGTSEYKLDVPEGVDLGTLKSEYYTHYASGNYRKVLINNGYIFKHFDNVGEYTDIDGYKETYDDVQSKDFSNYWKIELIFEWKGDHYAEYWRYTENRQNNWTYDYWALEYGIREKPVTVDSSFYDNSHKGWEDTTFDKLVYNRVMNFETETAKEQFAINCEYLMGHQFLKLPFSDPVIKKYAGYDTRIDGDMSLEYSMELETYAGQEIICGMDGKVNILSDRSFSVYNKEYGTLYYEYVTNPTVKLAEKGKPIAKSQGDTLRITFIDNKGNYINPLLIFS